MRIGHNPAFVFLSNPKCGSTSIRAILGKHSDIYGEDNPHHPVETTHLNAHALKSYFEDDLYSKPEEESGEVTVGEWGDYYKFTTVRNPWKKMASYYFFWAPDKDMKSAYSSSDYDRASAFSVGFNDWLKYAIDGRGLPNYDYFCCDHNSKELLLDDVFKLEEIDEVLPTALKEHLDIDVEKIPKMYPDFSHKHIGNTKYTNWRGDYYSLYNQESKDIISQVYESDIEKFNYSFGD